MTLERSKLWPVHFQYLGAEHSKLYEQALAGEIPPWEANAIIVQLLEHIAAASRVAHTNSRY